MESRDDLPSTPKKPPLSVADARDIASENAELRRLLQERDAEIAELRASMARTESGNQDIQAASEERFRLLVEGVRDYAIFLLDTEGKIVTWNAGAQRIKGYFEAEVIGKHFSTFYSEEDIAADKPRHELEIAAATGAYDEEGWRFRKDGSRFWASVVITALRDAEGELRGFAKVTRDVTEQRRHEQERTAAALAEQQRQSLRVILASVTDGRLILCDSPDDLPRPLPVAEGRIGITTPLHLRTLRHMVERLAVQSNLSLEARQDLLTAVAEAAMNAITHGESGESTLFTSPDHGTVQVWITDHGKGIELSRIPEATLRRGYSSAGTLGHGLKMIHLFAHRAYLYTSTAGTTVVLEQERELPRPPWLSASYTGSPVEASGPTW